MDSNTLQELLDAVQAQGGGLVLKQGDMPQAVVLSVGKYQDMLAASKKSGNGTQEQTAAQSKKKLEGAKVLVTGGAGYIGSHVVRELLSEGAKVFVFDNLSYGKKENVPQDAVFIQGDILDKEGLSRALSENNITSIVHLAALVEMGESGEKASEYLEVNMRGTLNVLEEAAKLGIQKFVFSSTAAVYGNSSPEPLKETAVTQPIDPYGTSKLLAEQAIAYFAEFLGIKATIFRYFNAAGGVKEWGIKPTHDSHLITQVLKVAKGEKEKLVVNGADYATQDGSAVRDYVHVRDLARAHAAALSQATDESFALYNIGTGKGHSVKEVINQAAEVTGRMIPMEIGPRRPGDSAVTVADSKAIKDKLGFETKHSDLENIIKTAWEVVQ